MPFVDDDACELNLKIVYHGPGLGGKTTNLLYVHEHADPNARSKLTSVSTETERTLLFSFLPPGLAPLRGYTIRLHLYTVPGPVFYDSSRLLALKGVSGVVFVADSQPERLQANVESLEGLYANLEAHGRRPRDVPIVFQYNKRDLPNIMSVEELDSALDPDGRPRFAAAARLGHGVAETLDACASAVHAQAGPWVERTVYR